MSQPSSPAQMSDDDLEQQLTDLLGGLDDEDLNELIALAEAMQAEGDEG